MEDFDNIVGKYTTWLDNPYVAGALTVFLIVYAGAAAPKLPSWIVKMFDYTLVKLALFFLIVFISRKNATVAIVAAIALLVSIMVLNRLKFDQEMMAVVGNEETSRKFKTGNCTCTCDSFEEIVPQTEEGKLVAAAAKQAVEKGVLPQAKAEELVKKVAVSEAEGKPVLVAKSEVGAKRMEEIAVVVSSGQISEEVGKEKEAVIVVAEAVAEAKQQKAVPEEARRSAPEAARQVRAEETRKVLAEEARKSLSSSESVGSESMVELKQEVLKRKQEETARRGGVPPSNEELKKMCANVLDDYRKSASCGKDCGSSAGSSLPEEEMPGVDSMASSYASVSN